jgi:predicted nuclease of predicted toxin-antitoxin system
MRFLVDNQLPPTLANWLRGQGHDAIHVFEVGLAHLDDRELWSHAESEAQIIVSKDEDFLFLANQSGTAGRLLWVRLGNCRNAPLLAAFAAAFVTILAAFELGQTVVELT